MQFSMVTSEALPICEISLGFSYSSTVQQTDTPGAATTYID